MLKKCFKAFLCLCLLSGCSNILDEVTEEESETTISKTSSNTEYIKDEDYDESYSDAEKIDLDDVDSVKITKAGTYILSGTLNGQVVVDSSGVVRLVLNDATITNDESAIVIENAEKTYITLKEGTTNTISDGTYTIVEANAAIYSKDDLTINGSGTLKVTGNTSHGIYCKDNLVITNGNISVTSVNDGIKGKDGLAIDQATIEVNAQDKALISSKNKDGELGWIYICGGTLNLTAQGDGIHANGLVTIDGGTICINGSDEGIEGQQIIVNDGTLDVTSNDDGFNASDPNATTTSMDPNSQSSDCSIEINGGSITVSAQGDGLDSNGTLEINGGTVIVYGPTNDGNSSIDTNSGYTINGGTVIALGMSGMAESPEDSSTQAVCMVNGTSMTGDIQLLDGSTILAQCSTTNTYNSILISTPEMSEDGSYTFSDGTEVEMTGIVTVIGSGGMSDPGQGMGGQEPGRDDHQMGGPGF